MKRLRRPAVCLLIGAFYLSFMSGGASAASKAPKRPSVSARSAVLIDPRSGKILYSKRPYLRLPPASTTKLMTVMIALERLKLSQPVTVSRYAASMPNSKAGLVPGVRYRAIDLIVASLVSSSNDAAVALAEAVSGSENEFAALMNQKADSLGMKYTNFVNATGLPDKRGRQVSTAYDLALLMRAAAKDARIDRIMAITFATIKGSDGRPITLKSHNKMLFRRPGLVKGKTGWTYASRHTFVGTNYDPRKLFVFAMLSSKKPWTDIERLAQYGQMSKARL